MEKWTLALANTDLCFAYPFMALGFVFVPAAATWTFGQALSMLRFCGLALIVLGITSHALTE